MKAGWLFASIEICLADKQLKDINLAQVPDLPRNTSHAQKISHMIFPGEKYKNSRQKANIKIKKYFDSVKEARKALQTPFRTAHDQGIPVGNIANVAQAGTSNASDT